MSGQPTAEYPRQKVVDDVVTGTFKRLWGDSWGEQMEELMTNVAYTILYSQALPVECRPTLTEFAKVVGEETTSVTASGC